jgi:RNA polymerase subunit RPABC4/transcription elongation factor Spt4/TM2 domain-containing membrane protein YozV
LFCKNCGRDIRDDSQFCWNCGTKMEIKKEEPDVVEEIPKKIKCKNCDNEIYKNADICPHCGIRLRIIAIKNPGVAAILSFFIPGLGNIYNGEIMIGVAFLIIEILLGAFGIFLMRSSSQIREGIIFIAVGFIFWIYNIYSAYKMAEKKNTMQYG